MDISKVMEDIPFVMTRRKYDKFEGTLFTLENRRFRKNWLKRKFALLNDKLICYDHNNKIKKVFELTSHAKIDIVDDSNENMFSFTITDQQQKVSFASETIADRGIWINAILESQRGGPLITLNEMFTLTSFVPEIDLLVTYRSGDSFMNDGNELIMDPKHMGIKPLVDFKPISIYDVFSILLIDSILSADGDKPLKILWFVVDVKGSDVTSGKEIINYTRPTAPTSEECHRYSLILIRQSAILTPAHFTTMKKTFSTENIDKSQFLTFTEYIDNNKPSACAIFRCLWTNESIEISNKIDKYFYGIELRKKSNSDYFIKRRFIKIDSLTRRLYWSKSIDLGFKKYIELSAAIIHNNNNSLNFEILDRKSKEDSIKLFFSSNSDKIEWLDKVTTLI